MLGRRIRGTDLLPIGAKRQSSCAMSVDIVSQGKRATISATEGFQREKRPVTLKAGPRMERVQHPGPSRAQFAVRSQQDASGSKQPQERKRGSQKRLARVGRSGSRLGFRCALGRGTNGRPDGRARGTTARVCRWKRAGRIVMSPYYGSRCTVQGR